MEESKLKERLRERLDSLGITQKELAERTGDSVNNLRNWLGGETQIPAAFLVRYARAVPVNLEWLLLEAGVPEPLPPDRAASALAIMAEVVDATRSDDEAFQRFYGYWMAFRQFWVDEGGSQAEGGA